jgi:hypothetical protein
MSEFLDMLSVYYTCDAMAAMRPLTTDEFSGCMDVYEAVKRYFAPVFELAPRGTGGPRRADARRLSGLRRLAGRQSRPRGADAQ